MDKGIIVGDIKQGNSVHRGIIVKKGDKNDLGMCNVCSCTNYKNYKNVIEIMVGQLSFRLCNLCAKKLQEEIKEE